MTTILIKTAMWGGPPAYEEHYSGKITVAGLREVAALETENDNEQVYEYVNDACSCAEDFIRLDSIDAFLDELNEKKLVGEMDDCSAGVFALLVANKGETNEKAHARINKAMDAGMRELLGVAEELGEDYDEDDWGE